MLPSILPVLMLIGQTVSPLTLQDLLAEVHKQAPPLSVQRAAVGVAEAGVGVAGAWEDPVASFMVEEVPFRKGTGMNPMWVYRLEQPITPLFGRRRYAKEAARSFVGAEEERLRRLDWDLQTRAVDGFYELWMNEEMNRLISAQIELLRRMLASARARYKAGLMMAHHDVLRTETEIAVMESELAALSDERHAIAAMLNFLQARPPEQPLGEPVLPDRKPIPSVSMLADVAVQSPEIKTAEAMKNQMEARQELAASMYYPMVMVGGMYQQRTGGMPDTVGAMVGLNVPIFWWDRQNKELAMANAMVLQAEEDRRAMLLMTQSSLQSAVSRALAAERLLEALEKAALPRMRETVAASQADYVSGRGDFLDALEAAISLLGLEIERVRAVVRREVARFEISRVVGTPMLEAVRP